MDYRTDNFFSPAAAAAAVAAHQPYHYLNQQPAPYSYNPYNNGSYVNGVSGSGTSSSPPSNPSSFFGNSTPSQYSSSSLQSSSPFSTSLSRYAGKFSTGLSKLSAPAGNVSALYPGSGLASLVASGTSYNGPKDFAEELLSNSLVTSQKLEDNVKTSFEDIIKDKVTVQEKTAEKCRPSPGLSVDSVVSSPTEGKFENDLKISLKLIHFYGKIHSLLSIFNLEKFKMATTRFT